jgi:hypothetical protein
MKNSGLRYIIEEKAIFATIGNQRQTSTMAETSVWPGRSKSAIAHTLAQPDITTILLSRTGK